MPPKPFPYPLGVGVDACRTTRILQIMKNGDSLNRWTRRIFTRLEWSAVYNQINMTYECSQGQASSGTTSTAKLCLPSVSEHIPSDSGGPLDLRFLLPPIKSLARYLAGRWAAKEAAIKAHRHRKLYLRDISIVQPVTPPLNLSDLRPRSKKPFVLIEPVPQYVIMDPQVALSRGLIGVSPETSDEAMLVGSSETISGHFIDGKFIRERGTGAKRFVLRKRLVKMDDRQVAELSISHDGPYVIAVCMACDEEVKELEGPIYLADDGSGDPMHEPIWGDRGWLEESLHEQKVTLNPNSPPSGSPTSRSPSISEIFESFD